MQLEVTLTAVVNVSLAKWTLFGRWSLTNEARVHSIMIIMFNVVAIHDCTCSGGDEDACTLNCVTLSVAALTFSPSSSVFLRPVSSVKLKLLEKLCTR